MTVTTTDLLAGKRVFIAGPMRGYPDFNFPAFKNAREALRERGIDVFCPAERDEANGYDFTGTNGTDEELQAAGFNMDQALADGVHQVLNSDCVVVLPGWQRSAGARTEMAVALKYGKTVYTLDGDHRPYAVVRREQSAGTGVWVVTPL
jgi:hypothetical protein